MGLFNTGKNEKVEKVEKYEEEHHDAAPSKPHHRSSKHHPKKFSGAIMRPMPQPSLVPNFGYQQPFFGNSPQFQYPFSSNIQYDLSKYIPSSTPYNQFYPTQFPATNFSPNWSMGLNPFTDRSAFLQQPQPGFQFYQQNGYMPPMNF